jgi:hypothetical protein
MGHLEAFHLPSHRGVVTICGLRNRSRAALKLWLFLGIPLTKTNPACLCPAEIKVQDLETHATKGPETANLDQHAYL